MFLRTPESLFKKGVKHFQVTFETVERKSEVFSSKKSILFKPELSMLVHLLDDAYM